MNPAQSATLGAWLNVAEGALIMGLVIPVPDPDPDSVADP